MYDIEHLPATIDIGFTGEQRFREVQIDMSAWMEDMPDGVPSIVHIRPGESEADAYLVVTTFENNILTWVIKENDLGQYEGAGSAQIWLEESTNQSGSLNVVKRGKSTIVATRIHKAIDDASPTPPSAQETWFEQILQSGSNAEAFATGTRGGTPVGVTDPAFNNHARHYKEACEQQALMNGFMFVYIDENGHLIYQRSENLENIDFELDDGRLILCLTTT